MTIQDMHTLYKLSLDKVGNSALPYFEPEAVDFILNYGIKAVMKQKISGNNVLRTGAEETTKRKLDLQTMVANYEVSSSSFYTSNENKPFGVFVPMVDNLFYILDEEVNIGSYVCPTQVLSGQIIPGQLYIVESIELANSDTEYNGTIYSEGDIFIGKHGITTFTSNGLVKMTKRVNVLPIRNDQYNALILDPFNRPNEDRVFKLEYGITNGSQHIELISSKDIQINNYYLRYYKTPAIVNYGTNTSCDLPDIIHEEIVDFAVSWTLESIESPRFQTQIANMSRDE